MNTLTKTLVLSIRHWADKLGNTASAISCYSCGRVSVSSLLMRKGGCHYPIHISNPICSGPIHWPTGRPGLNHSRSKPNPNHLPTCAEQIGFSGTHQAATAPSSTQIFFLSVIPDTREEDKRDSRKYSNCLHGYLSNVPHFHVGFPSNHYGVFRRILPPFPWSQTLRCSSTVHDRVT